ncbi:hypothetical protein B0H17DRAFT_1136953 [Mycena rosella]|uniref:Uncharacterized protein n=1 Tax=Mycena rosella TaxID=1033263 RepID=A0AAD7DA63_MYCRO|nr:hypothetical protein B0H17DRAFT_1136953 [Mycena rosella]
MELEVARAELSSHQLEVPNMVRGRGELVISSIQLHLAALLYLLFETARSPQHHEHAAAAVLMESGRAPRSRSGGGGVDGISARPDGAACPFDPGYCPLYEAVRTQVYELVHTRKFRAVPQATAFLQTYQYHQLPPFTFLTCLPGVPTIKAPGIKLTPGDASLFKDLNSSFGRFNAAVKASRKRKKAAEIDAEMDEEA